MVLMTKESLEVKVSGNAPLLNKALNDVNRIKHSLSIIFNTKNKHPSFKAWQENAIEEQTEEDIQKLYRKNRNKNTSYSYFTGIGGLIDLDFDWEWTYHLLKRKYPEKMDTMTIRTPNGGYRCLYIVDNPKDYLKFRDKPPKVEIHGNKGKHVIVHGKGNDDNGELKEYELINDSKIKKDPEIIDLVINFLETLNHTCSFLQYNCIKNALSHKKNHCTHEQRTSIAAFFSAEKIPIEDAIDFFRTFTDFDYNITKDHLVRVYEKQFKHPTCGHLKEVFQVDCKTCTNCIRKDQSNNVKKSICQKDEGNSLDISQIDDSNIFSFDDNEDYTELITQTPITVIDGKICYLIPLKQQIISTTEDNAKKEVKEVIGFYGDKAGYGFDPISFYTENNSAQPKISISDVLHLDNDNQQRMIELCIKKSISAGKNEDKSQGLMLYESIFSPVDNSVGNEIYEKLKYYLKLDQDVQYVVTTCFILGTYLFPLFASYGYLIVSGEKGTGKGTFLDLMVRTCWNATNKQVSVTGPTLFRTISKQFPTLIIDEYHRTISNSGSGRDLVSILEAGYDRGGTVPRNLKKRDEKGNEDYAVINYPVYCPKVLATRKPVEADEKGIKIILTKLINDKKYSKRKKNLYDDPFFTTVRKELIEWAVRNQEAILKEYNQIEPTDKLNGREFNVWLPILAVCKTAFPDKYDELLFFAEETISNNRSDTYEKENRVLRALNSMHAHNTLNDGNKKLGEPSYKVTNKEIYHELVELENEGMHHNAIKSAMENLKLAGWSSAGQYFIKKARLLELLEERGFIIPSTNS